MVEETDNYMNQSGSLAGYNYPRMVVDLEHGREIEFTVKNYEFGIFRSARGWYISMADLNRRCSVITMMMSTTS